MKYILSLGTNIGNKKENLQKAVKAIDSVMDTGVVSCSSIYETEPVGYANQDNFYNIAILVESKFEPNEMLGICMGIEASFGRIRNFKNGPRILDVDLILSDFGNVKTDNLILPHPRYSERKFVLVPMLELFPKGEVFGINFEKHIDKIQGQDIKVVDKI